MGYHSYRMLWDISSLSAISCNPRQEILIMRLQIIAAVAAVYTLGFASMTRDLNCTEFQATVGLSTFTLGFGVIPLVTASFSEEFGRLPLYIVSGIGFFLMFLMIALYVELHSSYSMIIQLTFTFYQGEKHSDGYCCTLSTRCLWVYGCDYGGRNHC